MNLVIALAVMDVLAILARVNISLGLEISFRIVHEEVTALLSPSTIIILLLSDH